MSGYQSIAHKEQYDFEQTEYFNKTLREERYKIEAKNAETKLVHGLCKARTVGLSGVRVQSYLTHIVTNLKRITDIRTLFLKECFKHIPCLKHSFLYFLF